MKHILLVRIALTFLAFCVGFFVVFFLRTRVSPDSIPQSFESIPPPTGGPTPVTLRPPDTAFIGKIETTKGSVGRIPWDSPDTFPASPGGVLYQDDELITKANSSARVTIPNLGQLTLDENSHILFGSMVPERMVFQQKSGVVKYTFLASNLYPVSIRNGRELLVIASGSAESTVDMMSQTIVMTDGTAKLALVDTANTTRVWQLAKNNYATLSPRNGRLLTNGKEIITPENP